MDEAVKSAESPPAVEAGSLRARVGARVGRLFHWAMATRLRMAASSVIGLVLLGIVFATWSYLGHLAVDPIDPVTLDAALATFDEGRYEDAKAMIGEMQEQRAAPEVLGRAMFVVGAVKAHEAGGERSTERRRDMYQLAARYLAQARELGLPAERQSQAAFLLGQSLVESGQSAASIPALEAALSDKSQPQTEIHWLLIRALLDAPEPDFEAALAHHRQVLADAALPPAQREQAWITCAETLMRLNRLDEAQQALDQAPPRGALAPKRALLSGKIEIDRAERLAPDAAERAAHIDEALADLREALRLDRDRGPLTRQAMYWSARCFELRGDQDAAVAEYARLSKLYGDTAEGLTAALAEADHYRRAGQLERALAGYRSVLESISDPLTYDNPLLPLAELRQRLSAAYQQFVNDQLFVESLTLADLMEAVLGRASCVELRAKTHLQWGSRRLEDAAGMERAEAAAARQEGRYQLRAAGRALEDLARVRYATRQFTNDLWAAADSYFRGQSYSNAARLLQEYLHHEATRWNAMALLRLGQSRLALNQFAPAISALEECIEIYPQDSIAYQARLECARAYQQLGKLEEAEQLLLSNLNGDGLKPTSPEWRDSLFALGRLLYESERYDESIRKLQEAVDRYKDADEALLAKYTIARAYHCAAEGPAKKVREAKTDNERQKNRQLMAENLTKAYEKYQEVQETITLAGSLDDGLLDRALLRNCYMMQGSALFELRRFEEARQAYGNVITLYQHDPIVLESFVQVANCWRRLEQPIKARVTLDQAKLVLDRLPSDVDFLASTNFNRQQWQLLLDQMSKW